MGQAPTRIFFFLGNVAFFVFFVVLFVVVQVSKKKWIGVWVGGVWPIRVFLGFLDLDKTPYNLTT